MAKIGFLMNAFGTTVAFAILLFAQRNIEIRDGDGNHIGFTFALAPYLSAGRGRKLGSWLVNVGPAVSFFFVVGGLALQAISLFW